MKNATIMWLGLLLAMMSVVAGNSIRSSQLYKAQVQAQAALARKNISALNRIWWAEPNIVNVVQALDSILELTR
jgi:hypothetical protein